jgi:hypothetical protein
VHRHPSCDIDLEKVVRVWMEDFEDGQDQRRRGSCERFEPLPRAGGREMPGFNSGGLSIYVAVTDNLRDRCTH